MEPGYLMGEEMTRRSLEEHGIRHDGEELYREVPADKIIDKTKDGVDTLRGLGRVLTDMALRPDAFAQAMADKNQIPLDDKIGTPGFELETPDAQESPSSQEG